MITHKVDGRYVVDLTYLRTMMDRPSDLRVELFTSRDKDVLKVGIPDYYMERGEWSIDNLTYGFNDVFEEGAVFAFYRHNGAHEIGREFSQADWVSAFTEARVTRLIARREHVFTYRNDNPETYAKMALAWVRRSIGPISVQKQKRRVLDLT